MKVNIQRIAQECGVSIATVSRVFNYYPNVRDDVRQKVINKARELGYQPQGVSRKKVIAIITPESNHNTLFKGYMSLVLSELTAEIYRRGFSMELIQQKDIELLNFNIVSGAISINFNDDTEEDWGNKFNIPLICLNSSSSHVNGVYSIGSNEELGMKTAVEYLYGFGHRRIGLIYSGACGNWCNQGRISGYKKACAELRLEYDEKMIFHVTASSMLYEPLGRILRSGATAIVVSGENYGIAIPYILNLFGKIIPTDISVITWEYDGISQYCIPPQTTLRQDFRSMCHAAIDLLETLWHEPAKAHDILIDYKLIKRDSVSKPDA